MKEIKDLISQHREIILLLKGSENEKKLSDDGDSGMENSISGSSSFSKIDERLEYLEQLECSLALSDISIDYPEICRVEETGEAVIFFERQIEKFNMQLLALLKTFAEVLTFSSHMPNIFHIYEVLQNNVAIKALTVNAEYFSSEILTNDFFVKSINSANNFHYFYLAIGEADEYDRVDEKEICHYLTGKIDIQKSLLIRWSCGKTFFKNAGSGEVKVITFKDICSDDEECGSFSEKEFLDRLEDLANFNIRLIYRGIMANYVKYLGDKPNNEYDESIDLTCIDYLQEFQGGWRLIDYAALYGDELVIQAALRSGFDLSQQNSQGLRPLEIATEFGSPRTIITLLDLSLPVVENKGIPANKREHLETKNVLSHSLLFLSVNAGKTENVRLLLQLGMDPSAENVIQYALAGKRYEIAKLLLKAGAIFPAAAYMDKLDRDLRILWNKRFHVQCLIEFNKVDQVKTLVLSGHLERRFVSTDNHSAPYIAFVKGNFEIYAFLKAHGFSVLEHELGDVDVELLNTAKRQELRKAMLGVVHGDSSSTVIFLLSKSRILQIAPHHFDYLKEIFSELVKISEIKAVLEVLEYSGKPLDILFDFDSNNVEEISAVVGKKVAGSCDYKTGRIFIGAKVEHTELVGTVAHELTHQAMQILYDNVCNPFPKNSENPTKEAKLTAAIQEVKNKGQDDIIKRLFGKNSSYTAADYAAESIVRVPHMLAKYGETTGRAYLLEQAALLTHFYTTDVLPACAAYVAQVKNRDLAITVANKANNKTESDSYLSQVFGFFVPDFGRAEEKEILGCVMQ